jgi:hypothetical protein
MPLSLSPLELLVAGALITVTSFIVLPSSSLEFSDEVSIQELLELIVTPSSSPLEFSEDVSSELLELVMAC